MTRPDLDQLDRDELAARRAERDRHREPGARLRAEPRELAARRAFYVSIGTTASESIPCPECRGPVYAPADSDLEQVDCFGCDARLVTAQGLAGLELRPL